MTNIKVLIDALQKAKETIEWANQNMTVHPASEYRSLMESWGNDYMNSMHEIDAALAPYAEQAPQTSEIEELHQHHAELKSLRQSILESPLKKFFPVKEMSFHDKVVFAISAATEGQVTGKSAGVWVKTGGLNDPKKHGIYQVRSYTNIEGTEFEYGTSLYNTEVEEWSQDWDQWYDESGEAGKLPEQQPVDEELYLALVTMVRILGTKHRTQEETRYYDSAQALCAKYHNPLRAQSDVSGEQEGGSHD